MEIIIQDQGLVQVEVSQDSLKTYLVVATLNKLIILEEHLVAQDLVVEQILAAALIKLLELDKVQVDLAMEQDLVKEQDKV